MSRRSLQQQLASVQTSWLQLSEESPSVLPEFGSLEVAMASGLSSVVVLALCVTLAPCVSGEFLL